MFTSKEEFEQQDGAHFPGKVFSETLLKPIFYDQKEHLFDAMFMIHNAHTKMLAEQKILTEDEAATILHGVEQVENMDCDTIEYHAEYEDLFFWSSRALVKLLAMNWQGKCILQKVEMIWAKRCTGSFYEIILKKRLSMLKIWRILYFIRQNNMLNRLCRPPPSVTQLA